MDKVLLCIHFPLQCLAIDLQEPGCSDLCEDTGMPRATSREGGCKDDLEPALYSPGCLWL